MDTKRMRLLWASEKAENPNITRSEFFSKFGIDDVSSRFFLVSSYEKMSQANNLDELVRMSKHRRDGRSAQSVGDNPLANYNISKRLKKKARTKRGMVRVEPVSCCKSTRSSKLSPTDVLSIYTSLFYREKTQAELAAEYNVWQSSISDIWRGARFDWIIAPLKFQLEAVEQKSHQ